MLQIPSGNYELISATAYDVIGEQFKAKSVEGLYITVLDDTENEYLCSKNGRYDPVCGLYCRKSKFGNAEDMWTWQGVNSNSEPSNICKDSTPIFGNTKLRDRCLGVPRISMNFSDPFDTSCVRAEWEKDDIITTYEPGGLYQGLNFSLPYKNLDSIGEDYAVPFNYFDNPLNTDPGNLCKQSNCSPFLGATPRFEELNTIYGGVICPLGCISPVGEICTIICCKSSIELSEILWNPSEDTIKVVYNIPRDARCAQGAYPTPPFDLCYKLLTPLDGTYSGAYFQIEYAFARSGGPFH